MFLLEITSKACDDPILARSLSLVHTFFQIICIVAPILLIVTASIAVFSMMTNPDQKNGNKKIFTKFIAAIIIFFLPYITDLVLSFIPDNQFSIVDCWNAADKISSQIKNSEFSNWVAGSSTGGNLHLLSKYAGGGSSNNSENPAYDPKSCSPQYLNGGTPIPIYYQSNPNCDYGKFDKTGESVAEAGCGFTSMAMILTYLTDRTILPSEVVNKYQGYFIAGSGMSHSLPKKASIDYGVTLEVNGKAFTSSNKDSIIEALKAGKPILARGEKGTFSDGGHYIVLRGVDSSDNIYVNNPNYYLQDQNTRTWAFSEIDDWATKYWIFQAKS